MKENEEINTSEEKEICCPRCHSTDIEKHEAKRKSFAWWRVILGIAILALHIYRCFRPFDSTFDMIFSFIGFLAIEFYFVWPMISVWPQRDYYKCKNCKGIFR